MIYRYEPADDTVTFVKDDAKMTFDYSELVDIIESVGIIRDGNDVYHEIPEMKGTMEMLDRLCDFGGRK